jgi:hypothetical protein
VSSARIIQSISFSTKRSAYSPKPSLLSHSSTARTWPPRLGYPGVTAALRLADFRRDRYCQRLVTPLAVGGLGMRGSIGRVSRLYPTTSATRVAASFQFSGFRQPWLIAYLACHFAGCTLRKTTRQPRSAFSHFLPRTFCPFITPTSKVALGRGRSTAEQTTIVAKGADSGPKGIALGRPGIPAIAVIPFARAEYDHRIKQMFHGSAIGDQRGY